MTDTPPEPPKRQHEDQPPQNPATSAAQLVDDLVMGVRFFSRLPIGNNRPHERPDLNRMAAALPVASIVIGVLPALLLLGCSLLGLPRLFGAGLAVGAAVVVGGGMAEDAIADAADGLFGGGTPERRLEIMKDSRHGTFGVSALCLYLLLRVAALSSMLAVDPVAAPALWLAAMLLARSGSMWLTVELPPARPDGASASVGRVTRPSFAMGALFALILALVLAGPSAGLPGFLVAVALVAVTDYGWTGLCRRLVRGQTGDLIGALQALLEVAALAGFLLYV